MTRREPWHGDRDAGYLKRKCRCDECRDANASYMRKYRAAVRKLPVPDEAHGKPGTYTNKGCHCALCREAHRLAGVAWRGVAI